MTQTKSQNLVAKEIESIKSSLGLTLQKDINHFLKERTKPLFTSVAELDGQKVVFRSALNQDFNKSIKREVELYTKAKELGLAFFPQLLNHGTHSGMDWLVYKYVEGIPAGNVYQFRDGFNYEMILTALDQFQTIVQHVNKELFTSKGSQRQLERLLDCVLAKNSKLATSSRISAIVEKVKSNLSKVESSYFVHGDLHPKNIFSDKDKIHIIDWESAHFNSIAFDYSFIWIRSYDQKVRDLIWQDLLNKYNGIENEAATIFLINLLRDYFEWHQTMNGQNELIKEEEVIGQKQSKDIICDLEDSLDKFSAMLKQQGD